MTRNNCLLTLALLATAVGCTKHKDAVHAAVKPDPVTVKTASAVTHRVDRTIFVTGSLNPDETVNVSFEVAGRVSAIHTDFGQSVRKGDVIAELDKQEYQLQVDRSRAALAQALARMGLGIDVSKGLEETVPTTTPALRQALAQLDDSKFKYESAAKLVKSGDVSQEHYTELEKAWQARQAAVEMLRDEIRMQWANVESLKADLKLAQKRLNDTEVRAPFDGAITQKLVSPGQYLKENTPVATLVKSNPLRLLVEVPESAAGEINIGTTLRFNTDAIPDRFFDATVRQINPSLDAKSRSLTVEARITVSDTRLRPGMFVQVQLVTARNAAMVVVPSQAFYSVAGLTKVFVIRDGHAVECRVPPGQQIEGWSEVPGDQIKAGELVAISNQAALVNGAEVVTRPAPPAAAPAKAGL